MKNSVWDWRGPATTSQPERKRGRPRLDIDDEERKQRHREAALRCYYKRKARMAPCFFFEAGEKGREALR